MSKFRFSRIIRKRSPRGPETASRPGRGTLGISLAGAVLAAGAVYLCRYAYVHDLAPGSLAVVAAGLGLIAAFCVLTAAVVGGIRQIIIDGGIRFQAAAALGIALVSLAALIGLVILGVRLLVTL